VWRKRQPADFVVRDSGPTEQISRRPQPRKLIATLSSVGGSIHFLKEHQIRGCLLKNALHGGQSCKNVVFVCKDSLATIVEKMRATRSSILEIPTKETERVLSRQGLCLTVGIAKYSNRFPGWKKRWKFHLFVS
jgi:hypothetical protein